jgi:hypothetical protein
VTNTLLVGIVLLCHGCYKSNRHKCCKFGLKSVRLDLIKVEKSNVFMNLTHSDCIFVFPFSVSVCKKLFSERTFGNYATTFFSLNNKMNEVIAEDGTLL